MIRTVKIQYKTPSKSELDRLHQKMKIVYDTYKTYYECGVRFQDDDYFETHDSYHDLAKCWGVDELERVHNMIIEHQAEFYVQK